MADESPLYLTADGSHSVISDRFGVSYHSKHGAVTESNHVFIAAGLHHLDKQQVSVLEIGFGTGLNALLTWQESVRKTLQVVYHAYEKYPISASVVADLNYQSLLGNPDVSEVLKQIHAVPSARPILLSGGMEFVLYQEDFHTIAAVDTYDLVYFDAFAPETQPDLWDEAMFSRMHAAMREQGVLVTYCAKGIVRRAMLSVGFTVEKIPGPPGKREMLRATKPS